MKRVALLALLGMVACDAAVIPPRAGVEPYEYRLDVEPPQILRWPSGSTIRVYVAESDPVLRSALQAGAEAWNAQALFGEYHLVETQELGAADVVLRWSLESTTVDVTGCLPAGPRAVTTFCAAEGGLEQGLAVFPRLDQGPSRVKMLVTVLSTQAGDTTRVQGLVAHELGHVLGLMRHSVDARDLMYAGDLQTLRPSARDVATIRVLYQMEPQVLP